MMKSIIPEEKKKKKEEKLKCRDDIKNSDRIIHKNENSELAR